MSKRQSVLSGMRPTGALHIGHYHGALKNWVRMQQQYDCYFFAADWHALTTHYESVEVLSDSVWEMFVDWFAAGIDPAKSTVFIQSRVPQHAELFLLLAMATPLAWLERVPTYKDQIEKLKERDLSTYGFLGYPLMQAADILIYRATQVPVGEDQVPHIELTREIARRFNALYRPIFPEPQALLTEIPRVPGTDGRKMSKSYGNAVLLCDPPEEVEAKLSRMMTDPRRVRRRDPGEPADCPAFNLHRLYCTPEEIEYVSHGCRTAGIGCLECKKVMIRRVLDDLAVFREKRAYWESHRDDVSDVLRQGERRAREVARQTMAEVREVVGV